MKKHLLALLSVGSLVTLLPGCGSCCDNKKEEVTTTTVEETASTEVDAVNSVVTDEAAPAQDAVAQTPAEDKH